MDRLGHLVAVTCSGVHELACAGAVAGGRTQPLALEPTSCGHTALKSAVDPCGEGDHIITPCIGCHDDRLAEARLRGGVGSDADHVCGSMRKIPDADGSHYALEAVMTAEEDPT